jgi:hypothetical protein
MNSTNRICPWCSTPIPTSAAACPKCHALVEGAIAKEIPGVTAMGPKANLAPGEGPVPEMIDPRALMAIGAEPPVNLEAVLPPSEAVRLEMRKIALETQIENAGTTVMNPTGDESIEVNAPSIEAIEAYEAGMLDKTGPAGETDLGALAGAWEDPELEKRVSGWHNDQPDRK